MTNSEPDREQSATEEMEFIPFHFDVPDHSLPLYQFIDTAKNTQSIIDNFNQEFFEGKVKYQIYVVTPREGGLIEILGILVSVPGSVLAFLSTEIGKAFTKGLTGQEPIFWAERFGKNIKEYFLQKIKGSSDKEKGDEEIAPLDGKEEQKFAALIIVQIIIGFLKKEPEILEPLGLSKEKFWPAYRAKNNIYQGCIDNPEVKGLGFDTTHTFPITRKEFPRYIVEVPPEIETEEAVPDRKWVVDTPHITVYSPSWKRESRGWRADTRNYQDVVFSIEDENFWAHVEVKDIRPDIKDNMHVQWAYPEGSGKPSGVRVLRVLKYNGTKISDPLTEEQIKVELENYSVEKDDQMDLFENDDDNSSSQENQEG
ncbi:MULTISPECIES: hypothetical protein [unclassified Nitrospina]|uniref:hypothetical protein n=1 Tax=unclassified Nitrospina TaxID=2638683 RepID=UPI003F9DF7DD